MLSFFDISCIKFVHEFVVLNRVFFWESVRHDSTHRKHKYRSNSLLLVTIQNTMITTSVLLVRYTIPTGKQKFYWRHAEAHATELRPLLITNEKRRRKSMKKQRISLSSCVIRSGKNENCSRRSRSPSKIFCFRLL